MRNGIHIHLSRKGAVLFLEVSKVVLETNWHGRLEEVAFSLGTAQMDRVYV